jgi:hypothetical protein
MKIDPQDGPAPSGDAAPKSRSDGRRKRLFALVAVVIPTLIGVLIIGAVMIRQERLVRDLNTGSWKFQTPPVYLEEPGFERTGHRYLFDPHLGWKNVPGWKASTKGRSLTINSKGLRDREYPYERTPGVKRVLVLGDSFTWGYGVSDEAIYTEVLERKLAEQGRNWEIINAGVSGWGTDQEYLFLKAEALKYQPDLVILALYLFNDPDNNCAESQYALGKPVFLNTNLTELQPPVLRPEKKISYIDSLDPAHITLALIDAIEKTCTENEIRFMVMSFGLYGAKLDPYWAGMWKNIGIGLEQRSAGYPVFDLDQAFVGGGYPHQKLIEGNDDGHWNAYGHGIAANLLNRFLVLYEKPIFEGVK